MYKDNRARLVLSRRSNGTGKDVDVNGDTSGYISQSNPTTIES